MAKSNGRSRNKSRKMKRRTMRGGMWGLEWVIGSSKPATPVVSGTGTSNPQIVEPAAPAAESSWSLSNLFGSKPAVAPALAPAPPPAAGGGRRRRHKRTSKK